MERENGTYINKTLLTATHTGAGTPVLAHNWKVAQSSKATGSKIE